ncbi:hypothetical protein [Lysobacter enzymogenes]|uniref:hypothetical protein n=1 Tax=Lysobacter enzymogenes TaxID=69 RepID=UPI00089C6485|nr:hypothetical protein [Lysobacter enzymogenes]SDX85196.1 hypothetical protein SAMN05421681_108184 [Lysobacter enzymogenes]
MPVAAHRIRFIAFGLLALAAAGCVRDAPEAQAETEAPQEASAEWQAAFQRSLGAHLRTLAAREDAQSRLDLLRLQLLLQDFSTKPSPRRARERLAAIAGLRETAPAQTEADWYHAELCVRPHPPASQGCDPAPALRRLQAAEPDNAAVWLLAADAADARQDPAGFDSALRRAAAATAFELHYGRHWSGAIESLERLPLPPLDAQTRRYLRSDAPEAATAAEMRATLATLASPLPLPTAVVLGCRNPAPDRREACVQVASLMADSNTLIGQTLGLSLMARLSADAADGPAWRERLRQAYWRNAQARERAISPQFAALLRSQGEVAAYDTLLRAAGRDRAPPDWLPESPLARDLVRTGRAGDEDAAQPGPAAAPAPAAH